MIRCRIFSDCDERNIARIVEAYMKSFGIRNIEFSTEKYRKEFIYSVMIVYETDDEEEGDG